MKISKAITAMNVLVAFATCTAAAWGFYQPPAPPGATGPANSTSAAPQASAPASGPGQAASSCCTTPAPRMIERTICVPTMAMEKRLMPCVEYTTEPRVETFTLMHAIPEKKTITRQCVEMVPETRTRMENYVVCKPVPCNSCSGCCGGCKYEQETKQREVQYTVCVPHTKQYSCDVTVCKYVPEQRTITVDACVSHIVEKPVDVCVCHMVTKKILIPAPTCCCMPCCGPCGCCDCGPYGRWGSGCW